MLYAYVAGPIVITVGYWVQRGADTEAGARVEIRRVEYDDIPGAAPGVAGLRFLPVSHGVWRADLFRDQVGNVIYHFHPHFEKGDVGERSLDERLTADPVAWVIERLRDLRALLVDSGAADIADAVPYGEVEAALPRIGEAIEASFTPPAR